MRVIAFIFGWLLTLTASAQAQGTPTLGSRVEAISTRVLRNNPPFRPEPAPYNLGEDVGRRAVLILYWLPDYQTSVNELVELEKLARATKPGKLTLLAAARARNEAEVEAVRRVVESKGITLPVILDDLMLMRQIGVTNVPSYVALGPDGRIRIHDIVSLQHKLQDGSRLRDIVVRAATTGDFPQIKGPGQSPIYQLIGEIAPPFSLKDMTGRAVNLKDYTGQKPLLLVFWSAKCPHCQKEMPRIQAYYGQHADQFQVLSITRFADEAHRRLTQDYIAQKRLTFPVLVDEAGVNEAYSVEGIPTWMIVDTAGRIRYIAVGEKPDLEAILDRELPAAAKPASPPQTDRAGKKR